MRPLTGWLLIAGLLAACGGDPAKEGEALAKDIGCFSCHAETSNEMAPTLHGLWGTSVALDDGSTVIADAEYVRHAIVNPPAEVVSGWSGAMPFFPLNEEEVDQLVEWVRSLQ